MSRRFEELDWQNTEMGEISLRRRLERTLEVDVYEVKLGEEFLMSSLFPVAEIELARLGLAACAGAELDVVVGGLGLGYTAVTALEEPRVRSLVVVEALGPVIGWHEKHLLPDAATLTTRPADPAGAGRLLRPRRGDRWVRAGRTRTACTPCCSTSTTRPRHVLHPSHAAFYTPQGLRALHGHLHPGGVFALWSDDPPDDDFVALLRAEFGSAEAHVVSFANPLTGGTSANTVYVAVD